MLAIDADARTRRPQYWLKDCLPTIYFTFYS